MNFTLIWIQNIVTDMLISEIFRNEFLVKNCENLASEMVMKNRYFGHRKSWNFVSKVSWEPCHASLDIWVLMKGHSQTPWFFLVYKKTSNNAVMSQSLIVLIVQFLLFGISLETNIKMLYFCLFHIVKLFTLFYFNITFWHNLLISLIFCLAENASHGQDCFRRQTSEKRKMRKSPLHEFNPRGIPPWWKNTKKCDFNILMISLQLYPEIDWKCLPTWIKELRN